MLVLRPAGLRRRSLLALAALAAVVLPLPPPVTGHSYLTYPRSMSRMNGCRVGGHEDVWVRYCPGPCPNTDLDRSTSPSEPAAVWARGGRYSVTYARNNHEAGFVRWALVPVSQMHDKAAHARAAFMHSCWVSDRHKCESEVERRRDCVVDRQNSAFRQTVVVPDVYPDGDCTFWGRGRSGVAGWGASIVFWRTLRVAWCGLRGCVRAATRSPGGSGQPRRPVLPRDGTARRLRRWDLGHQGGAFELTGSCSVPTPLLCVSPRAFLAGSACSLCLVLTCFSLSRRRSVVGVVRGRQVWPVWGLL